MTYLDYRKPEDVEKFLGTTFLVRTLREEMTVKQYLAELLSVLWREGEGFSGKRPLGNSGWQWEVYEQLVRVGVFEGSLDEDGFLDDFDDGPAEHMMLAAIKRLGER